MDKLVYPELSYRIMGILFKVYNEMGYGYKEKHYQRAIAKLLRREGINFKEQLRVDIRAEKMHIGHYFMDFVIEGKIVLEIKVSPKFSRKDILQVLRYLKETGMNLGILAAFSRIELIYKRILRGLN